MNADRRKRVKGSISVLAAEAETIQEILDEEQEAMDCVPESFQGSAKFADMEDAADCLEQAISSLEDAISSLEIVI